MKLKVSLVLATLTVVLAGVAAVATPSSQAAPPHTGSLSVPVNDTVNQVVGTFNITSFQVVNGALQAVGTFTGTVAGVPTTTPGTSQVGTAQSTGSCRILDLVLGPLHLDLLGLVVDLNQVHLTITAQRGPGNLLGNLLCALAGLLDNTGSGNALNQIVNLLNQILARL